jgi:hypothetical protein
MVKSSYRDRRRQGCCPSPILSVVPYADYSSPFTVHREQHNRIPTVTVTQIEKSIGLQINEVATLWTPIYDVVHPGHWDPTQFSEYSCEHFVNLQNVSHRMIRDMVDALTTGGTPATMNISVDARIHYLFVSSSKKINNIAWPTNNPHLPSETSTLTWSSHM